MFDNQNKNFNPAKTQSDSVDVSTLPLRTMEKDLKNINNPAFNASDFMPEDESAPKKPIESNLSEKQKTSPFLNPAVPAAVNAPAKIQSNPSKTAAPIEKKAAPPAGSEKQVEFDTKKVIMFAGGILIILIGAAAGYYFITKKNPATQTAQTQPAISKPTPPITITPPANNIPNDEKTPENGNSEQTQPAQLAKINTDKPNFLVIAPEVKSKADIQDIIKKKIEEIKTAKIYTPVEFVISDNTFAPLTFQDFSQKFGLTLPSSITSNLKPTFSLFISTNEKNQPSLALLADIKDGQALVLKPILSKEEAQLIKEIDALFLGTTYQTKGSPFSTNSYKNAEIRFYNIQLDASMTLDYAIFNSKLMLATSKSLALAMIDKILAK